MKEKVSSMNDKNKLEDLEKKYKELGEEIERLKNKKESKRVDIDDKYYFINNRLQINFYEDQRDYIDDRCFELGNYFKTNKEAEKTLKRIKTYIELKKLAEELNEKNPINWNDDIQSKYHIRYDYNSNDLSMNTNYHLCLQGAIYCTDSVFLNKAIERIGKERLIDLIKGE